MTFPVRPRRLPLSVDGGEIGVWAQEDGGLPILFLHGWSLDHRIWGPQFDDDALARHRLIAIDRRGFGSATAPPGLDREVADAVALLDHLAVRRAIVVGQSQAGRVALRLALDHADRVAGLVLVGSPVAGFHPLPKPGEDVPVDDYRRLVAAGRLDEMKRLWAGHPMLAARRGDAALTEAILRSYDGRDLLAPPPPPGPDIAGLGAIAVPSLVVTGDGDTAWRRLVGDAIAYALARGERAGIPAAGHLCNRDAPAAFNRLLARFAAVLD